MFTHIPAWLVVAIASGAVLAFVLASRAMYRDWIEDLTDADDE